MYRNYYSFSHLSSKISYSVYGTGDKVLLVFHGFGHSNKNMKGIEECLGTEYKIYSLDLFFHGFSDWNYDDSPLSKEHWLSIINAFTKENEIQKFSVLGYSLGGKVALSTVELMPERIDKVFLIAPDGIGNNFWYKLVTTSPLKSVFRQTIDTPGIFYTLIRMLGKLHLIDKSTLRFSSSQMNSKDKRRRVYYSWLVYKGLQPNMLKIISLLNKHGNKVIVYLGKYDRIIRSENVTQTVSAIKNCKVNELNSGHNNLLEEVANHLNKEFAKI